MNKKLKIIYFADIAAEHTLRWVLYFAKLGHEIHIVSWNDMSSGYRLDDVKNSFNPATLHIICNKRPTNIFSYIKWIFSIINKTRAIFFEVRPDLIHSHSVGAHAWITLFLPKVKSVMTPWGTDVLIDMKESTINRFLSLRALKRSTVITVDAKHMEQKLVQFGVSQDKVKIIYFGTNTGYYSRSQIDRLRIRKKYNIKDEDVVVISTRTLNPIHDVFLTLKSIPIVLSLKNNIKFIIASDGSEREDMEEYVSKHNLSNHVIFPGYMTMPEMVAFLSASDIYVSSSKADAGLAASTAEAMSIGLPVVVSNNSENSFWVNNSGLLFEDGDFKGIADGILNLANNPQLMKEFGENGRDRISRDNDYKIQMNKVNDLYLSIVNKIE
jgi:L-malate glycosyltransferase